MTSTPLARGARPFRVRAEAGEDRPGSGQSRASINKDHAAQPALLAQAAARQQNGRRPAASSLPAALAGTCLPVCVIGIAILPGQGIVPMGIELDRARSASYNGG